MPEPERSIPTNAHPISDNTPVLIGAGQVSERVGTPEYRELSPADLTAQAARAACDDALSLAALAPHIDALYAVRTMADSLPAPLSTPHAPFGAPDHMPGAIARRLALTPAHLVYSPPCGDEPQRLVGELCERLHAGELKMALLCGGEAISTMRAARAAGKTLSWSEHIEAKLEDRRGSVGVLRTREMTDHGLQTPASIYPLFEQARRARLGLSREDYRRAMAELMAPFAAVAAQHPHASSTRRWSAEAIATVDADNRMIADPHPLAVVARDQVNLAAALVLTTVGTARALGVPQERWVFLHGYSALDERPVLQRPDLGRSPAMQAAYELALTAAGVTVEQVRYLDLYSCFPIAVFVAIEALGLKPDDPRGLTLTGGLPYFGGPGNNYSMHAIATLVQRLRAEPGAYGLIGANGGLLSSHAVGVYSTTAKPFTRCDSRPAQRRLDAAPAPALLHHAEGNATVESYTVLHDKQGPTAVLVVGRCSLTGARFLANAIAGDAQAMAAFHQADGLKQRIVVRHHQGRNLFALDDATLNRLLPPRPRTLQPHYEHVLVERRGHVLEVTINRPQARNALVPESSDELEHIFDAYEADEDLWVAIITGAGTQAFCAGIDLRAVASGRRRWLPRTGFGGLTARSQRLKPVIAAVNGYAIGGGFEIALACDMVVADASAQFALNEPRIGLIPSAGGVQRLVRQIPPKLAHELLLTGRRVRADEAHALGIVNRVVSPGQALDGARTLADELLQCSPTSIRLIKGLLLDQSRIASEADAVLPAYDALDRLAGSEDRLEGLRAVLEKREPRWRNR